MKHVRYEIQMHLIKKGVDSDYDRARMMPLAEQYNLAFLLDACMVSLKTSVRIRRLMKNDAYNGLSDRIKDELKTKLAELSAKEENDPEYHRKMAEKVAIARFLKHPFDPDFDD